MKNIYFFPKPFTNTASKSREELGKNSLTSGKILANTEFHAVKFTGVLSDKQ